MSFGYVGQSVPAGADFQFPHLPSFLLETPLPSELDAYLQYGVQSPYQ